MLYCKAALQSKSYHMMEFPLKNTSAKYFNKTLSELFCSEQFVV